MSEKTGDKRRRSGSSSKYIRKDDVPDVRVRRAWNLRRLRAAKGWKQIEAAHAAGVTPDYMSTLENGGRALTLRMLDRLAPALGLRPAALLAELDRPTLHEVTKTQRAGGA